MIAFFEGRADFTGISPRNEGVLKLARRGSLLCLATDLGTLNQGLLCRGTLM